MKNKFSLFSFIVLLCLLIASCKVSYLNIYETYLEGSPNESLQFQDSIISVSFVTKPNGIYFDIHNLTKNNLYLIWDRSYFIEPSGSSSKLLNTDILETNSVIREKENNESVIPQQGHFQRFTCSAKNVSLFSSYNSKTLYNEITNTITTQSDYYKFFLIGNYWYPGSKRDLPSKKSLPNVDKLEIAAVQKFVAENNNLALGFTIRNLGKEIEYHFRFPIKNVDICNKTQDDIQYIVRYHLDKNTNFKSSEIDQK